jgi:hypothetical protein
VKIGEDDLKRYRGYRNLALELTSALRTLFEISMSGSTVVSGSSPFSDHLHPVGSVACAAGAGSTPETAIDPNVIESPV